MKLISFLFFLSISLSIQSSEKPNVVFFLVDDLGIKDLA